MRKALTGLAVAGIIILFPACKPTENNYRAAYEAAQGAVERKARQEAESASGGKLEAIDGPRRENFDGETIMVGRRRVKAFETTLPDDGRRVGVAIARYSVPTNARRHLEDVKQEYPEALIATDGTDNYYVMIERVKTIPESVDPIRVYRAKHPDYGYQGLGGEPQVFVIQ